MSRLLGALALILLVISGNQAYANDYKMMQQYKSGRTQDATSYMKQQRSHSGTNYDQYDASKFEVQQMIDSGDLDIDKMDRIQRKSHSNSYNNQPYSNDLSTPGACPYGMCDRKQR